MAIREIRKDGDPVLRKKSKPVAVVDEKIREIVRDMIDTMYEADGVGLAAPQVGILKRILVIDIYDDTGVKVLINPEFIEKKGTQEDSEGCLSVPGVTGLVKRPEYVKIKGLNENGEEVVYEAKELLARAFCHEVDHLDGVLFTDLAILDEDEA